MIAYYKQLYVYHSNEEFNFLIINFSDLKEIAIILSNLSFKSKYQKLLIFIFIIFENF